MVVCGVRVVAMCGVVPVRCSEIVAVTVRCSVRCCCCGSVVVVGTRGGAGAVVGSSLSPRVVVGVVATAGETAAAQTVVGLEEDEDVVSTNPVVALVAETCLDEAVEAGNVEDPVAKATGMLLTHADLVVGSRCWPCCRRSGAECRRRSC